MLGGMESQHPELRASDADRERVALVLRDALESGRLSVHEFDERLVAVYEARTHAELAPITRDLPEPSGADLPAKREASAVKPSSRAIAVMSGFDRKGPWRVPKRFSATAFWGGGTIDLREAHFDGDEVVIRCFAIMGGVEVIVPPDIEVDVRGTGLMGGFDHGASGPGEPGKTRVVVTGLAFWGGVDVRRKRRRKK